MKALTIWQPWASLIILGAKFHEFRGRPAPRSLIGQRIAIHAGKRPAKDEEIWGIIDDLRAGRRIGLMPHRSMKFLLGVQKFGASPGPRRMFTPALLRLASGASMPLGAVLGSAVLGQPRPAADVYSGSSPDRWAWPLSEIEAFAEPIPAKGAQGFWDWDERAWNR